MLRIQVLGHGMIPRGYGLAPHKELFWADKLLIQTILTDAHLQVNMQHPEDGRLIKVTRTNLDKLWNSYSDKYNTNSTSNKISTEVIAKPKTLIDRNHDKINNQKSPVIIEVKNAPDLPAVNSKEEKAVVEDLQKAGFKVASDKEFDSVVEKAINESSKNNDTSKKNDSFKKNDHKKDEVKNETVIKPVGTKPVETSKENETKKDEINKSETLIRPINNPENK